ncbi:DNA repair protein RecN [Paraconexibacter algicola]|uniref:DNA repair protein RecN n=1 Tax=Paraconexibacter algicola TaxID=2133960 RepID=A0A2T4UCV5_9ACTN|nr:DNA repair protein RecN [Paraconexibacter algicola]
MFAPVPSVAGGSLGGVLHELRVENLLLIERAELRLTAGLNVLTGETGAGKTVLAHALDLLLGGKARAGIVRPGASEAWVEGVFDLPDALRATIGDRLPEDAEDLVLARRVSAEGRTRAYVGGRTATVSDLQEIAAGLISFYGQHEHRKLTLATAQLDLLDSACGPGHLERRAAFGAVHARARGLERRLEELREVAGARERELDLLQFELAEIEAAAPDVAEAAELRGARERLRHVEALRLAAHEAADALAPEDGEGVVSLLGGGAAGLEGVGGVDAELDRLTERVRALGYEAQDVAGELRRYVDGLDADPEALEATEERLTVLDRLQRKYGGSIEAVLEHAATCRARRDELQGAEVAMENATAELDAARAELDTRARELRAAREAQAPLFAQAVRERLGALAMEAARFEVVVTEREPTATGADAVEFLIAANPGVPAGPLRDIASGGELSRVMLSIMGVANDGSGATLVFDEVDAGIGGVTARAVGEQLRELGAGRQVVCITHLPQIASLAARHFSIEKDVSVEPARTTVRTLEQREVVGELVRMLGAEADDVAARRHAKELLKAA